jgi:carbamoyltransferase
MNAVLGISAYYHDSAAALLINGRLVAAAQEERFSRMKHDASFPRQAVEYLLRQGGIKGSDIACAAFYEKPFLTFERLLETYHAFAPRGFKSFAAAMPVWIKQKLYMKQTLRDELGRYGIRPAALLFPEHHLSHAAAAFYPSPYQKAAILTIDGVGEWATAAIGAGEGEKITLLRELHFPHSLGMLYSAFTYYCGFRVNGGEYKLMGLAPYGTVAEQTAGYVKKIREVLLDIKEDGSFLMNMDYFDYATGLTMTRTDRWEKLFGLPPRKPESELTQPYMNLALAAQQITEDITGRLAATARRLTGRRYLTMAGGVALNCVANGKIRKSGLFDGVWIQPASGDAGGALGAALAARHIYQGETRSIDSPDGMAGAYLGPGFTDEDVQNLVCNEQARALKLPWDELYAQTAALLNDGKIVGWFQGRMEFGPRALGNRSILADPRNAEMQKRLNMEIKFRESFRPFAPSVLEEDAALFFDLRAPSPYMLAVADVLPKHRLPLPEHYARLGYADKLYQPRSRFQAVTHVDFSARVQTVARASNPRFHALLSAFKAVAGCGLLVNTSFNVRGEPVVCTPADAYRCFMATGMDYLVIENYLFDKSRQPHKS